VDHGPGGHDDVVNAAAGVLVLVQKRKAVPICAPTLDSSPRVTGYGEVWRPFRRLN